METPLEITKDGLLSVHERINANIINNHKDDVINALGGLDNVLTMILSSNDTQLSNQQLTQINEILTQLQDINYINNNNIQQIDEDDNPQEWAYIFDRNNTFLNQLFGLEKGQKIFKIIYSKWCIISAILFGVAATFIDAAFLLYNLLIIRSISHIIGFIIVFIYLGLILLSANRKCLSKILWSFEFWLKLYYFFQYYIASFIFWYVLIDPQEWEQYGNGNGGVTYSVSKGSVFHYMSILSYLLNIINALIIIVLHLCCDALQVRIWIKSLTGFLFAVGFTLFTIQLTFFSKIPTSRTIIYIKELDASLDIKELMTSAIQILTILFWKQAIMSIYKKNKSTLLKYSPYIRWKESRIGASIIEMKETVQKHIELNRDNNDNDDYELSS